MLSGKYHFLYIRRNLRLTKFTHSRVSSESEPWPALPNEWAIARSPLPHYWGMISRSSKDLRFLIHPHHQFNFYFAFRLLLPKIHIHRINNNVGPT
jgi:hypothetical protein